MKEESRPGMDKFQDKRSHVMIRGASFQEADNE